MSFDISTPNLCDEITASRAYIEEFTACLEEIVPGYHGPHWRKGKGAERVGDPENMAFMWQARNLPLVAGGVPKVRIGTSRLDDYSTDWAKKLQYGTNRWAKDSDVEALHEEMGVDFGFLWGVSMCSEEPRPGTGLEAEDPPTWPSSVRLPHSDFAFDHLARTPKKWRWAAHKLTRDRNDVLREAEEHPEYGWSRAMLNALAEKPRGGRGENRRDGRDERELTVRRHEIEYWDIWFPRGEVDPDDLREAGLELDDYPEEDGYTGVVLTITLERDKDGNVGREYLRKPRPYWGPRWGPYNWCGCYIVPDHTPSLSPIVAAQAVVDALNGMTRAAIKALESYRKLILAGESDETIVEILKQGRDLNIYGLESVDDFARQVAQFEIGGLTDQHVAGIQMLRDLANRTLALSDSLQGNPRAGVTATAEAQANAAADLLGDFQRRKFERWAIRNYKTAAWILAKSESVSFPLGPEAAGEFTDEFGEPIPDPVFEGGPTFDEETGEEIPLDFDALDFSFEPYTMEYTDEAIAQRRAQTLVELMTIVVPFLRQYPEVDADGFLSLLGQAHNQDALEKLVDTQLSRELGALLLQAQVRQAEPQSGKEQPRLVRDLSPAPRTPSLFQPSGGGGGGSAGFGPPKTSTEPGGQKAGNATGGLLAGAMR